MSEPSGYDGRGREPPYPKPTDAVSREEFYALVRRIAHLEDYCDELWHRKADVEDGR
jgi:hypothetical protein